MSPVFELIVVGIGGLLLGAFIKGPAMPEGKRWIFWWLPNHLIPAVLFLAGATVGEFALTSMDAQQAGLAAVGLATPVAELLQLIGVSRKVSTTIGRSD